MPETVDLSNYTCEPRASCQPQSRGVDGVLLNMPRLHSTTVHSTGPLTVKVGDRVIANGVTGVVYQVDEPKVVTKTLIHFTEEMEPEVVTEVPSAVVGVGDTVSASIG